MIGQEIGGHIGLLPLPPITVLMTTWAPDDDEGHSRRKTMALALRGLRNLAYTSQLRLHIADDGSTLPDHPYEVVRDELGWDQEFTFSRQERHGIGASLNAGYAAAFEVSPLALFMTDDCFLTQHLDLTPWAWILLNIEAVGMVRLGMPSPNIRGEIVSYFAGWAWKLDRGAYAYAERPALLHKRFVDVYGPFQENIPGRECERLMVEHFAATPGPDVVLAVLDPWEHIGKVSTSDRP